jgi:hypothetical protein
MTLANWWQDSGWRTFELLWAVVALVGTVFAVRWRGRPAARWAAGAFAVMLLPGLFSLTLIGLGWLETRGNAWTTPWLDRLAQLLILPQVFRAAGFALLVPAIFAGRQPRTPADPDAG